MVRLGYFDLPAQVGTVQSFYNYYNNAVWKPTLKKILPAPDLDDDCGQGMRRRGLLCCPTGQYSKLATGNCKERYVPPVKSGPTRDERQTAEWKRDRNRKTSPHRPTPNGGSDTETQSADLTSGFSFGNIIVVGGLAAGGYWAYKQYKKRHPSVGGAK